MLNNDEIIKNFPCIYQCYKSKKKLIYLDTSSSAQKHISVINSINDIYLNEYSNVYKNYCPLGKNMNDKYELSRKKIQKFINAKYVEEIIFTKGATDSINIIANLLSISILKENDEIIVSEMDHHANIIPWNLISNIYNFKIKVWKMNDNYELDYKDLKSIITNKTKILAITHCSNVLGEIHDIKQITKIAHTYNILVVIDAAQSIVHNNIDVQLLDSDFLVFSGHKIYGPNGIGVLYGKYHLLKLMRPYQGGGYMIENFSFNNMKNMDYSAIPRRFEPGTPNIIGVISLCEAIDYINKIHYNNIIFYEKNLINYLIYHLKEIKDIVILGNNMKKLSIVTFYHKKYNSHDLHVLLSLNNICISSGYHCSQPIFNRYNIKQSLRVSLGIYNNKNDIDYFIKHLYDAINILK